MNPKFRPILGIGIEKVLEVGIKFPVLATPKFDGIRCVTADLVPPPHELCVPLCRSLKPVPNGHIRSMIAKYLPPGLDGEIMTYRDGKVKSFQEIQSDVMTRSGVPDFKYHVFDVIFDLSRPQHEQVEGYERRVKRLSDWCIGPAPVVHFLSPVFPVLIESLEQLEAYEEKCLLEGYEGVCFRVPGAPYKFGRSTPREQYLVKVKRFETAEAVVIGMVEEMHNTNPQAPNKLGYAERSSHKANMVGKGRMGALVCKAFGPGSTDFEGTFQIGTGFDAQQRVSYWSNQSDCIGRIAQYKHQPHGRKDRPRIPVFIGFRDRTDMDPQTSKQEELL